MILKGRMLQVLEVPTWEGLFQRLIASIMDFKRFIATGLAVQSALAGPTIYAKNGLTWTEDALRMNQMQVVGTHNSYHIESKLEERDVQGQLIPNALNFWYSHPQLDIQLQEQRMRNLEIDVLADPEGGNYARPLVRARSNLTYDPDPIYLNPGTKVLHIPDADINTHCNTLPSCLLIIKGFLDSHPQSVPLPIMMEFKTAEAGIVLQGGQSNVIPWDDADLLASVDEDIRSVFGKEMLITPDDLRRCNLTLEQSVLKYGWPDLDSARGRIFFLMDNGPEHPVRYKYRENRPNLEGRVLFTNSAPGYDDCAFQKLNDPTGPNLANIQAQVQAGYWVRTRADVPLETILNNCSTSMRDDAFASGAQIVSTDFQAFGMSARWGCDYAARLEGGKAARCNPVNGGEECDDKFGLEPEEYRWE